MPAPRMPCALREVRDGDLPFFYAAQADPVAWALAAVRPRDEADFHAHWARIRAEDGTVLRTVVAADEAGQRVLGNVLSWSTPAGREVGYWIDRAFWGRGVASAAVSAFLAELPERPLIAHVAEHNAASLRVLDRCGFAVVARSAEPVELRGVAARTVTLILS